MYLLPISYWQLSWMECWGLEVTRNFDSVTNQRSSQPNIPYRNLIERFLRKKSKCDFFLIKKLYLHNRDNLGEKKKNKKKIRKNPEYMSSYIVLIVMRLQFKSQIILTNNNKAVMDNERNLYFQQTATIL